MVRRPATHLLLATALLATACDGGDEGPRQVRENAFAWKGVIAPGRMLQVRDFSGGIEVSPSADDTVRVTARLEWSKGDPDKKLSFTGASTPDGGALICALWGNGRCTVDDYNANLGRDNAKVFFSIQVPTGVRLDLRNIMGDVVAAATAPVNASTMNGDVRVVTSVGPVNAETLNGSVDIRMASLANTDSIVAKTLNGDAFIYLPSLDDAVVDLGVGNGSVSSAFTDAGLVAVNRKVSGRVGAGTRVVHAYALNGTVGLRRLGADGTAP